jgi:uncharacterized protein (UPF0261 family)
MNAVEAEFVASAVAERLNRYENKARVKVMIPTKGFSSLSVEGGPLCEPASDKVFADTLRKHIDPEIEMIEVQSDINSREFAEALVDSLMQILERK